MMQDVQVNLALPKLNASSSKHAFHLIAREVADRLSYPSIMLFDCLMDKEKISSSGVGDGVSIPHLKLRGLEHPYTVLASLKTPVDFQAMDNKPVDLICAVISPERDGPLHLRRLSRLSRLLKSQSLQQKLRETSDPETMRSLLTAPDGWMLAA